jgi:DNA-binding MarR family transcriptional regulator
MDIQKLGHSLALAARWQERYINHHLESFGLSQRTLPFYLTVAHSEGISQKELMKKVVTDKTRTTKAVNHLVKANYVERRTNRKDNRINGVYLTDRGREIFPDVEMILKNLDQILSDELSEKELIQFITMLDAFSSSVHYNMVKLK